MRYDEGEMMLSVEMKEEICKRLVGYDKDIVEIIQFGSSVYAPEYARDVDLLVITKRKKDYGGYLDCLNSFEIPLDVVVKEVRDKLRGSFASNVLGAFEILYGDRKYLYEMIKGFDSSFGEAYAVLRKAKRDMDSVRELSEKEDREWSIRVAFNGLFHAARVAAMTYLAVENARWGRLKRRLPQPYKEEFDNFINILHVDYFYNGNYPANYEEEFEKWYKRVEDFVRRLEGMKKK